MSEIFDVSKLGKPIINVETIMPGKKLKIF
jgi:hypothetical protein